MRRLNNKGMTLVEVVVSIAILSLVSLAMLYGFLTASSVLRRGFELRRKSEALSQQLETMTAATGSGSIIIDGVTTPIDVFTASDGEDSYIRFEVDD